jgi:GntR family transcriptional regulator
MNASNLDAVVTDGQEPADSLFAPIRRTQRHDAPLYQLVESYLRDLVHTGKLVPGDLIPSEPQLAKRLEVSQGTIKKATDNLVWERLLFRHQGKGTYVSSVDFNNSLFRFFSYGDPHGKPVRIHKETTERSVRTGTKEMCQRLQIPEKTDVLFVERIGYLEMKPTMVEHSWWAADLMPGLEQEETHIPDLFYAVVVEKYGIPVVRAEETLTAEAADVHTARKLEIEPGAPVVVLKRMTFTTRNRVIEVRITKGRADKFSYKTEIR